MSHKTAATIAHAIGFDYGQEHPAFDRPRRGGPVGFARKRRRFLDVPSINRKTN